MKGQTALEYVIISGFVLLLLVPLLVLMFNYIQDYRMTIALSQIREIGTAIVAESEKIFFHGEGSQSILDVSFPAQIANMSIYNNIDPTKDCEKCTVLEFEFMGSEETKEYFSTEVMIITNECQVIIFQGRKTLQCSFPQYTYGEGSRRMRMKAHGGNVTLDIVGTV